MSCSRPACKLPADEGGLCFAHKSAFLIETVADVMRAKKIVSASTGGVSISLLPHSLLEEPETAAPAAQPETDVPEEEPESLRAIMGRDS